MDAASKYEAESTRSGKPDRHKSAAFDFRSPDSIKSLSSKLILYSYIRYRPFPPARMHTAYYCQPADRIQLPETWPLEYWVMAVPLHSSVARPALVGYAGARIGVEWSAWFCIAVLCGPGAGLSAGVSPLDG